MAHLQVDPGKDPIGIISASTLRENHVKDIAAKVSDMEKQGAKRLILDLRHNSTGSPEDANELSNLIMAKGLMNYTLGQRSSRQEFQASSSKAITKLPLVVLTNRATAGGAEVAAAALLDSKRAEVVGEKTFGDAAVRKAITLDDGAAVILSIAKY